MVGAEPVPVSIVGPTVRLDGISSFDEVRAAAGCLGLLPGSELMLTLLNYSNRAILLGHRLGRRKTHFVPRDFEPFKLVEERESRRVEEKGGATR